MQNVENSISIEITYSSVLLDKIFSNAYIFNITKYKAMIKSLHTFDI